MLFLNIVDGTNLERNLYLTTQLAEIGIPIVIAINMMDIVSKSGDKIDIDKLSAQLGCKIVEISALKGLGINEAADAAIEAANGKASATTVTFSGTVEHALAHIEEAVVHNLPENEQRWYSIKIFERDKKVLDELNISEEIRKHTENDILKAEKALGDDAEAIIINERYNFVTALIDRCYNKKNRENMTLSDKIDRVVTNRWAAIPIFAFIMFLVYYISIGSIGNFTG